MKKYLILISQQFYRDKHMILHAHNEADLKLKVEDMTKAEGVRLNTDEAEVIDLVILNEQIVS
jgi:hypothetical protein